MAVNITAYKSIIEELKDKATLIAVSKTKTVSDIKELYKLGQKDFGENYVQELIEKQSQLPEDIQWHFIGHLQSNKVKFVVPFVYLIHGVDSFKLLKEINKQAQKVNKVVNCLLQVHIAQEETKFGFNQEELDILFANKELKDLHNIKIMGLMGMASFTNDLQKIGEEFAQLKRLFDQFRPFANHNAEFTTLSMGMSSDYKTAIEEGSTMVRIGSLLFGARTYQD
ncbi:MAG: YggS family pyridoxal phosphate-dependent enzyme [Bacteroidetes bacterium]|nr:YggS family pyridoxal phosphate-dependent enzyme [Bacteroidota bacterium]